MIKYVACLAVLITSVISFSIPKSAVGKGHNTYVFKSAVSNDDLELVGTVGNKTYYIDLTDNVMNWTEAKHFCEGVGMLLGTVETDDEYNFLSGYLLRSPVPEWYYLTAALDSHTKSQLNWDQVTAPPTEITGQIEVFISHLVNPPLSCGVLSVDRPGPVFLSMVPCSLKIEASGALCQDIE